MSIGMYDENSFLKGVAVGLSLIKKAYDYIRRKSDTTPVTNNLFLEKQKVITGSITAHDIASRHINLGEEPDKIYLAYIEDGMAAIKSSIPKDKINWQSWKNESFNASAIDIAIEFDGKFYKNSIGEELITDKEPYVFWVTPEGALKCRVLGLLGESTLVSSGCTKVTAIRAIRDLFGSFDFGLIVFFIVEGNIYYRQLIGGNWTDAVLVQFGPNSVWNDIAAFRTQDYRVVLQAEDTSGNVFELFSQFQGLGKHGSEHIGISNSIFTSILTEIRYLEFQNGQEHLNISSASWGALYGGLYDVRTPAIIDAYNVEDENENWGTIAIFVFDKHLKSAEVASQYLCFSIIDSNNVVFTATSATLGLDGKTVTLTFLDYNNASGICQARYTPGTVTSMAGTNLISTVYNWTPENLVPSIIPVPEVYTITNAGITDIGYNRVRYYNHDGSVLLHTEYVKTGENASWGEGQDWSDQAEGEAISGILNNIIDNVDVYQVSVSVSFNCSVSGGYNGGAIITLTADGVVVFTTTATSGYYNLHYNVEYAEILETGWSAVIDITPPPEAYPPNNVLTIKVSKDGDFEVMSVTPNGSNTSYGYSYSNTFVL